MVVACNLHARALLLLLLLMMMMMMMTMMMMMIAPYCVQEEATARGWVGACADGGAAAGQRPSQLQLGRWAGTACA